LWGLPKTIVDAVARHHRPPPSGRPTRELDVLAITHIADALAFEVQRDESGSGDAAWSCNLLDGEYVASLGVADQVPDWRALATKVNDGRERQ